MLWFTPLRALHGDSVCTHCRGRVHPTVDCLTHTRGGRLQLGTPRQLAVCDVCVCDTVCDVCVCDTVCDAGTLFVRSRRSS